VRPPAAVPRLARQPARSHLRHRRGAVDGNVWMRLAYGGPATADEIARDLGRDPTVVRRAIVRLRRASAVRRYPFDQRVPRVGRAAVVWCVRRLPCR